MNSRIRMRIGKTARKHKIGQEHIAHALNNAGIPHYEPAPSPALHDTLTWIAEDDRGVPLVMIAAIMPDALVLIHVQPIYEKRNR